MTRTDRSAVPPIVRRSRRALAAAALAAAMLASMAPLARLPAGTAPALVPASFTA